jgi:hypothetical protein
MFSVALTLSTLCGIGPALGRRPGNVLPERVYRWGPDYLKLQRLRELFGPAQGPGTPKASPTSGFDYHSLNQVIALDPATGQMDATITMTIEAMNPANPSFYVLMDEGLSVTDATAPGYTVDVVEFPSPPYNYASMTLVPQVTLGQQVTVVFRYSGTLQCNPTGPRAHRGCGVGAELNHFMDGSAFPLIMDGADAYGYDTYSRSLTLYTPSGSDVLVSADPVQSSDDGTTLTTWWHADEFASTMYFIAITGDFATQDVAGTTPLFSVAHVRDSTEWVQDMVDWVGNIVPFLDDRSGLTFPFDHVNVVKLPEIDGFPGTATHSMVYLSEVYGTRSAEQFEETLSHEISHLWWGVLVTPYDKSSWLVEGPAVQTQYDYTWQTYYQHEDRDLYLAERYHWNMLLFRYLTDPATLPDLVLEPNEDRPNTLNESVTWAYFKSSATLDHLRVTIGEQAFHDGFRAFVAACEFEACTTADFRSALEASSGQDLAFFFDQWVYDTNYPAVTVEFTQQYRESDGMWEVTVDLAQSPELTLQLELWLNLADDSIERQTVTLSSAGENFNFETTERVRSVHPNPRHDPIIWSRSAQAGDMDFNMEVDGLDLIRCAWRHGRTPVIGDPQQATIRDVDLDFDPRCDINDDEAIDDLDVDVIVANFGAGVVP